jgi:heptosyltransferase-2
VSRHLDIPDDLSRGEILVLAPSWVGDVVMATPAFRALREGLAGARITLLTRPAGARILSGAPWFDEVVIFDRHGAGGGILGFLAQARRLRAHRYALAVILPNSLSSALLARLSGCRRRAGYAPGRGLLLNHAVFPEMEGRRRRPSYMGDYYLELLGSLGIPSAGRHLELFVTREEEDRCREFLSRHGVQDTDEVVALNPGASFGPSKLWRSDRFARVGDRLARERGARVVVLCGPGEEGLAAEICALMTEPSIDTSRDRVDLGMLKPLLRRTSLLVTTDTGTRHFGVAFGRKVVVLMGATDPRHTEGNLETTTVVRESVSCSPCHLKVCPIDHRCMERIASDRVFDACRELLHTGRGGDRQ